MKEPYKTKKERCSDRSTVFIVVLQNNLNPLFTSGIKKRIVSYHFN
jgi:hypothetical protein